MENKNSKTLLFNFLYGIFYNQVKAPRIFQNQSTFYRTSTFLPPSFLKPLAINRMEARTTRYMLVLQNKQQFWNDLYQEKQSLRNQFNRTLAKMEQNLIDEIGAIDKVQNTNNNLQPFKISQNRSICWLILKCLTNMLKISNKCTRTLTLRLYLH